LLKDEFAMPLLKRTQAMVVLTLVLAGVLLFEWQSVAKPAQASAPEPGTSSPNQALQSGKAGIYAQLPRLKPSKNVRDLTASNPLVAAVCLPVSWRDIEPAQGQFQFDLLKTAMAYWKGQGKRAVIQVIPYGQNPDDGQTPPWLYEQPDVEAVSFLGGGVARASGATIRVPAVWKSGFAEKHMKPLIEALAHAVDGDETIAYIMVGFGHLGNITAQSSPDGGKAIVAVGWTPEAWEAYGLHVADLYRACFTHVPLLAIEEGILIRKPSDHGHEAVVGRLAGQLAEKGVSVIHSGIGDFQGPKDHGEILRRTQDHLAQGRALVAKGTVRVGLGNDWPLWVPESRRSVSPTVGRDEAFLEKMIHEAFGGVDGSPETGMTIYFTQWPEVLASNPRSTKSNAGEYYYRADVEKILAETRKRLLQNDAKIFGRR
jgi:hypothetical protein